MQELILEEKTTLSPVMKEIYRRLRTNLEFTGIENKVICLTSCMENDGKSSVSFNLAKILAENDKRVLFIDADMRNSVLTNANVMHCMATALDCFGNYFENNKFDLLIILGDRYEMMAVAIAAAMQRIPILHLHGGEVTYGNYDEFIRHSITKMSQYHFTSTEEYRKRVIQLGEDPKRVFYLGALGAENCCKIDEEKVIEKVKELIPQKYWVVAFHPETLTDVKMEDQVKEVLTALQENMNGMSVIFMGTNADTKSDIIRSSWLNYVDEHENAYYYENLNVDSFLYLVKNSVALIGNSSSGIIETPSLGRYTINIGDRQRGRVHGNSVIDVTCDSSMIGQAMKEITGKNEKIINPYYVENTAENYYKKTKEILENGTSILKEFYDIV